MFNLKRDDQQAFEQPAAIRSRQSSWHPEWRSLISPYIFEQPMSGDDPAQMTPRERLSTVDTSFVVALAEKCLLGTVVVLLSKLLICFKAVD